MVLIVIYLGMTVMAGIVTASEVLVCGQDPRPIEISRFPGCVVLQFTHVPASTPFVFSFRDKPSLLGNGQQYLYGTIENEQTNQTTTTKYERGGEAGPRQQDFWFEAKDAHATMTLCLEDDSTPSTRIVYVQLRAPLSLTSSLFKMEVPLYGTHLFRWMGSAPITEYNGPTRIRVSRCSSCESDVFVSAHLQVRVSAQQEMDPSEVDLWSQGATFPGACGDETEDMEPRMSTDQVVEHQQSRRSFSVGGARQPVILSADRTNVKGRLLCPRALFAFPRNATLPPWTEILVLISAWPQVLSDANTSVSGENVTSERVIVEMEVDYGESWAESLAFDFVTLGALRMNDDLMMTFSVPDRRAPLRSVNVINGNAVALALSPKQRADLVRSRLLSSACFCDAVAKGTFDFLEAVDTLEHTDGHYARAFVVPGYFQESCTRQANGRVFVNVLSGQYAGLHLRASQDHIPTRRQQEHGKGDDTRIRGLVAAVATESVLIFLVCTLWACRRWCWPGRARHDPSEDDGMHLSDIKHQLSEFLSNVRRHSDHDQMDQYVGMDPPPPPLLPPRVASHVSLLTPPTSTHLISSVASSSSASTLPARPALSLPATASREANVSVVFSEDETE